MMILLASLLFAVSPLQEYREGKRIFISTDSAPKDMVGAALDSGFEEIHAVHLNIKDQLADIQEFGNRPQVQTYHGHTPSILTAILSSIQEPAVFCLDAFYREGFFFWGKKVDERSIVLRELAVIAEHPIKTHTILIGDLQWIGTAAFNFLSLDQLIEVIHGINPKYEIVVRDNVLVAKVPAPKVHVLYTSAQIAANFPARKVEYLRSFSALKKYGIDPWIIEATNIDHSFFDAISKRVFYPQRHKYTGNIGANELLSIRTCMPHFPFDDEDIVIKLTGRYWLFQPTFIETIRAHPEYDVYLKKWFGNGWFEFTGCFAMRWKHFKKMLEGADTDQMESKRIAAEEIVANYVKENDLSSLILDNLDVLTRINGIDETHAY